jgi:hypothetical protein
MEHDLLQPKEEKEQMKKSIILLAAALMTVVVPARLAAGDRFQVSLTANALFPADTAYRETYNTMVFLPEAKAAYSISDNLCLWVGYGLVSASGETPVLKEPAESSQGFLAAGAGYRHPLSGGWSFFGELGLARIAYDEEALGKTVSGSTLGFVVNAGLRRDLSERFFLLAQLGYVCGKKTIEDEAVKMGGAKAGLGAGVRF